MDFGDTPQEPSKAQPWQAFMAADVDDDKRKPDIITETIRLKYQADDSSLGG